MADFAGFAARKAASKAKGKLRGIGVASYIEACGIAPSSLVGSLGARAGLFEAATVRVNPTGSVTVLTGSHSHGQGHETTFAQVVADKLGIPMDSIDIVHGDTARVPFGLGTYGSRSIAVGGTAIVNALDKVIEKGRKIAAHLLEAAEADIEFKDGALPGQGHRQEEGVRRDLARRLRAAQVPDRQRSSRASRRPRSTTRRTSRSRPAPTSARSRSTRAPARSRSPRSSPPTTSATSSTR